jgi:hypothetical protein
VNGNRAALGRRESAEAWWAFVARVLAFLVGVFILGYQTVFEESDRLYLTVAAVGLCGPVVAQSVATVFASLRGNAR